MMTPHDWKGAPYKVFYFRPDSPIQLQLWLENLYVDDGLSLIAATGDYYIFKPIENVTKAAK